MAFFDDISPAHQKFIKSQPVFFVGTAGAEGRVNVSPKGLDSLRIVSASRVVWLNLTGSGNETSAHVLENGRMTLMFCSFEGPPIILRLYGAASVVHQDDPAWNELVDMFPEFKAARQIFDLKVDLVQKSCGYGVPLLEYQGQRETLIKWADQKTKNDIVDYWSTKNKVSMDGLPTGTVVCDRS